MDYFNSLPVWPFIFISSLIGLLAALIGPRISRATDTGKALREAFAPELHIFEHNHSLTGHMLHGVLIKAYPKHRAAVTDHRKNLGITGKFRLNRAWRKYHGGNEDHPHFVPYYVGSNCRQLFIERVHAITALTK